MGPDDEYNGQYVQNGIICLLRMWPDTDYIGVTLFFGMPGVKDEPIGMELLQSFLQILLVRDWDLGRHGKLPV